MIVVIIPAKGGSSRLPNKNMLLVNGKPMLDFTIAEAKASKKVDSIYVSTDSETIAKHAKSLGVEIVMRPVDLGGDVPIIEVYRHALKKINILSINIIVGMQPDHPDRTVPADKALNIFERENLDHLYSKENEHTKNGSYMIMSRKYLENNTCLKETYLIDNCTNVHYQADLEKAALNLTRTKNMF